MKNSQRGFIVPLIIIIAMLAIVGGVYIYNGNKQSNENFVVAPMSTAQVSTDVQATNPSTSESTNSPKNQSDTSSKTYTSTQYGFQFNYPSTLTLSSTGGTNANQSGTVQATLNTLSFKDTSGNEYFNVIVFPPRDQSSLTLNDYTKGYLSLGSYCDNRSLGSIPDAVQTGVKNGVHILAINVSPKSNVNHNYIGCYYLKNKAGDLVVFNFNHHVVVGDTDSTLLNITVTLDKILSSIILH